MTGFFGFNVQAQGVHDKERLLKYVRAVKPAWMVVLDGVGLAREIKAASPSTNVVVRQYQKDGYWIGKDPAYFLSEMRKYIGDADVWVYADNEVGLNPDWNIKLMEDNTAKPLKLAMIHLPVGNPRDLNEWNDPRVLAMLKMMSDHRDWAVCFFHEYFCAVPTSGMIGGFPDNAGVKPVPGAAPGTIGRNLIPVAKWPEHDEIYNPADPITLFHQGRFNFAVQAFKRAYPNQPLFRYALSEAGADDVSDIKDWSIRLKVAPGYLNVRGWRTLFPQWREWYKDNGWSEDQIYAEMLKYAAEQIYRDTGMEGACIYCYANANSEWAQFNIEGRSDLLGYLEQYAAQKEADVVTKPVTKPLPMPKPMDASHPRRVKLTMIGQRTVRDGYGANQGVRGSVTNSDVVTIYDPIKYDGARGQWQWVEAATFEGYLPIEGVSFDIVPANPPKTEDETLPSKPAAKFDYDFKLSVNADNQEVADKVAAFILAISQTSWNQFKELAKLANDKSQIKDASFELVIPKGG